MLSQERQSAKSPTSSVQSGSTRTGPVTNAVRAQSAASSISEKSEKSTVSSDSRPSQPVQKKPVGSSGSESDSGSERRAPPAKNLGRQDSSGSESDSKPSNSRVPPPPSLANKLALGVAKTAAQTLARRIMPSGRDSDKSERSDDSTTKKKPDTKYPTITKLATSNPLSAIPSSVAQRLTNGKTKGQSVFEQVDLHTGKASYLGSGNYRNLEECIRDCLSKDQHHRNWSHPSLHHHRSSWKNSTRASVLEDYSYDGVISSNSRHHYHHYLHDDDHHHHHSSHSLSRHHRHKSPADLTLEEIRHINDELAKYGIPVFSAHHHSSSQYQRPQTIGEILSACQMLSNNPTLNQQHQYNNHSGAVQHVWDQIHYYQPTMNPPPPPPPAFNSPSSGGGALAKLFGGPSAPPPAPFYPGGYPPAPPPPPPAAAGGGGGVLSKLFGQPAAAPPPPMQYNTGPSMMPPPSYPPPGPPPPAGGGSGQSVLASLFGGGR